MIERTSLALLADTFKVWRTRLIKARQQRSYRNPLLLDLDDDHYELIMEATAAQAVLQQCNKVCTLSFCTGRLCFPYLFKNKVPFMQGGGYEAFSAM